MKLPLLPLLLSLALLGCPPPPPSDFRLLAERAYPEGAPPDRMGMDALWTALFKLPRWHFLMATPTAAAKQPSVQMIGGEAWLLVFTDLEMLRNYAIANRAIADGGTIPDGGTQFVFNAPGTAAPKALNPHLGADGKPLFVSMAPEAARALLNSFATPIAGVRFNEGSRKGWFAPVSSLNGIHDFLKSSGKL